MKPRQLIQLDLFGTGIICNHCNQDPGRKPLNENQWNGFFDKDTSEHVCWNCDNIHYRKKSHTDKKGQYSEFPVIVK